MRQDIIDDVKERLERFITSDIGGTGPIVVGLFNNARGVRFSVDFTLSQIGYEGVKRTVPGGLGTHSDAA